MLKSNRSDIVPLPTIFYLTTLDAYVRGRLKAYRAYFESDTVPLVNAADPAAVHEVDSAILDIAEALVIGDGVALKLTGENTLLSLLVRSFGFEATVDLITRGAIRFDPRNGPEIARAFVLQVSGKRSKTVETLFRAVRTATVTITQDLILEPMKLGPETRMLADVAGAIISDTAIEHLKRRPPSAFFDEVIEPSTQAGL